MTIEIRELRPNDHDEFRKLWTTAQNDESPNTGDNQRVGVVPGGANLEMFESQRGLSVIARDEGKLVGAVLCGHTYDVFQHFITVAESHRDTSIAKQMLDKALLKFLAQGRMKCHIHAPEFDLADQFWESVRWRPAATIEAAPNTVVDEA